jgi:hypothetical protein
MIFRLGNDIFPGGQRFFEAFLWTTFMGLRNNRFTIMIRKTLGMITLRLNFFNARNMLSLKSTLPYSVLSRITKRSISRKERGNFDPTLVNLRSYMNRCSP